MGARESETIEHLARAGVARRWTRGGFENPSLAFSPVVNPSIGRTTVTRAGFVRAVECDDERDDG